MQKSGRAEFMTRAPLPVRDGVAPSRVYLPAGPWPTLLEFLLERFPYVEPAVLRRRLDCGEIVDAAGQAQIGASPYRPQRWLWYYREVADEIPVPFDLPILHRDEHLVVVDKPHFLASTPAGRYLRETALFRLRNALDLPLLSPIHRLDRDTAGVMLFSVNPDSRGPYQVMFQSREILKEYEAIAPFRPDLSLPCVHRSRIQPQSSYFTMEEVAGEPNSETRIELLDQSAGLGRYRLLPRTGRKHQLRVHMSALGIPICGDGFYPTLHAHRSEDDFERPLQLLARSIEFIDPLSGRPRRFESQRQLVGWMKGSGERI
ncbi:RluA family pseudouridine synthase [Paralcaligenes sp. KSB-10]|uniref:RluA family pseudouridine synthase n=1 Tax=Paralcaligenes sp. KSB-10 TaxID=2901142 RepID=UPI001E372B15|nr:RluA family pseudouridine synthase [Paralcaligenes sp. KSB-10]UHL62920.1 RluA family pseudouridine synthase [Paralcaligenes sp. KSB-10]